MAGGDDYSGLQQPSGGYGAAAGGSGAGYGSSQTPPSLYAGTDGTTSAALTKAGGGAQAGPLAQPAAAISPFPDQVYGPQFGKDATRSAALVAAIDAVKATLGDADKTRLDKVAFAIAKLGTNENPVLYAGVKDMDTLFTASLVKIALLYASFELVARTNVLAPTIQANDPNDFFRQVKLAWDAPIAAAVPAITSGAWQKVSFDQALVATGQGNKRFKVAIHPQQRTDLDTFFSNQLNSAAASRCMHRLGYSYVNGALAAGGFFDSVDQIWVASDFGGGWSQFLVPVATNGKSSEAARAASVAYLLMTMHRGTLVDAASSQEMRNILSNGGAWLSLTANPGSVSFTSLGAKVGHDKSADAKVGSVKSEGAFLDRGGTPFVAVWQNYPDVSPGPDNPADTINVYKVIDEVIKNWP